jgi:hypothetical protein
MKVRPDFFEYSCKTDPSMPPNDTLGLHCVVLARSTLCVMVQLLHSISMPAKQLVTMRHLTESPSLFHHIGSSYDGFVCHYSVTRCILPHWQPCG